MKKLNLAEFSSAKADFIANMRRKEHKTWEKFNNELSLYCACFSLPVIVAVLFAAEEFPEFGEELKKKEAVVREFYNYDE